MHDPMTRLFQIRWLGLTVWHVDPEKDGSDDSCGWSAPRLTKDQFNRLRRTARIEGKYPYFLQTRAKQMQSFAEAHKLLTCVFLQVGQDIGRRLSQKKAESFAIDCISCPHDNLMSLLAFLPGWHSNFAEDRPQDREENALRLFCAVGKIILRDRRPWWKHPRWHLHHWSFQWRSKSTHRAARK